MSYFFEYFYEYFFEQFDFEHFFEYFFEYFFELIFEAQRLMKPTSIIVLSASPSDWFLLDLELTHGNGILPGLKHPFPYPQSGEVHRVVSDFKGK